jgi:putative oxidoreductase
MPMSSARLDTASTLPVAVPQPKRRADGAGVETVMLLARVLLGLIFVMSGYGKLMNLGGFTANLTHQGVPFPEVLAVVGAAVEFGGGALIVLGFKARLAALMLVVFVAMATLIAHRFWELDGAARTAQNTQFMKNVAIEGGLMMVVAVGAGCFSLDGLLRRRIG